MAAVTTVIYWKDSSNTLYIRNSAASGYTAWTIENLTPSGNRYTPWSWEPYGNPHWDDPYYYKRVVIENAIAPKYMGCWFSRLYGLETITGWNNVDLSNVENMPDCFDECYSLTTNIDVSTATNPNLTNLYGVFQGCNLITIASQIPSQITDLSYCFHGCHSITTPPTIPEGVMDMYGCFWDCKALTYCPTIPSGVTNMQRCFQGCTSITEMPLIPNGVTEMWGCFMDCSSLSVGTSIPSSVTSMANCFEACAFVNPPDMSNAINVSNIGNLFGGCKKLAYAPDLSNSTNIVYMWETFNGCSSLSGNITCGTTTAIDTNGIFSNTLNDIYIISSNTSLINAASGYPNVHVKANDNPAPSLTSFVVTRVDSDGSTTYDSYGEYAYIQASVTIYNTYLPVGWVNTLGDKIFKVDGSSESLQWTITNTGNTYTLNAWFNLQDTIKHSFELTVKDSVSYSGTVENEKASGTLVVVISGTIVPFDMYHAQDSYGLGIGTPITAPELIGRPDGLLKCTMDIMFTTMVGEIKMWAGINVPNGWLECDGSEVLKADYPILYNAIADLWGTASDNYHFVLPNFSGRVPVGASSSTFEWVTIIGEGGGTFVIDSPTYARFGDPATDAWVYATIDAGTYTATYESLVPSVFPSDPAPGAAKTIQVQLNVGSTAGTSEQLLTVAEMPSHNHTQNSHGHSLTNAGYFLYNTSEVNRKTVKSGSGASNMLHSDGATSRPGSAAVGNTATNNASGGGKIHSQMQPFAVVKYIICAA